VKLILEIAAGKDVLTSLATVHTRVTAALKQGVRKAGLAVEGTAKRLVYGKHPERLVKDKGGLGRSITTQPADGGYSAIIGPNVIYAAIHEFGGVIKPKKAGGSLVFKPSKFSTASRNVRGASTEYSKRESGDDLVFARKVTIPARPYMHPALDQETPRVQSIIANTLYEAIL
jgi:phage gpG-like protein